MQSARGNDVDGHGTVFRINGAPTQGYEKHVGRRTTVRFHGVNGGNTHDLAIAWGTLPKLPAASEESIPVCVCPPVRWVDRCWRELSFAASNKTLTPSQFRAARAPRLNPSFMHELRDELRRVTGRTPRPSQHPTTGAVAIAFALRTCQHVSLFGFGSANCSTAARVKGTYYEKHVGIKGYLRALDHHHEYASEQEWIRQLVRSSRVMDQEGCFQR
jgi:beta-galactoside alpha-2,3-sialyltransferase (sialyltransferase 4B)